MVELRDPVPANRGQECCGFDFVRRTQANPDASFRDSGKVPETATNRDCCNHQPGLEGASVGRRISTAEAQPDRSGRFENGQGLRARLGIKFPACSAARRRETFPDVLF